MNMNRLTRSNILAHAAVNAGTDDIRILYGAKGVALAEKLVAEGLVSHGAHTTAGRVFPTYHLTPAGRSVYRAD